MGSRLSPIMSDIFCHMMETKIILQQIEKGNILHYNRYVDDCILIIKKGTESVIQKEMDSFDHHLKFTFEKMINNELPFLDTCIYLDAQNVPQIKFHRKPSASDVKMNFKLSVAPKKYKISSLTGEIYQAVNCTSTDHDKEGAIEQITDLYKKNGYPTGLIDSKIKELRGRNFQSANLHTEKQLKKRENPYRFYHFPFRILVVAVTKLPKI